MVIDLQEPFASKWRKGYLQTHPGGRRYICLYNSNSDRTIVSYARYLKNVELGYLVPSEYDVDHRDEDFTNDDIGNLQVLPKRDNVIKSHVHSRGTLQSSIDQTCVVCQGIFRAVKVRQICFQDSCKSELRRRSSLQLGLRPPINEIGLETVAKIHEALKRGMSQKATAETLGVARSTVRKYLP